MACHGPNPRGQIVYPRHTQGSFCKYGLSLLWTLVILTLGPFPFCLGIPEADASEGNALIGFGPIQKGLGGAGAASPKDASWMALNPATLVDLERRVDVYFEFLGWSRSLEPDGPPFLPLVNKFSPKMVDGTPFLIPGIGVVWPLKRGTLGFGIYGSNGTMVDYARPRSVLGFLRNSDRRSEYWVVRAPVAYARPLGNGWAVAFALNGNFTRFRSDSATLLLRPAKGDYAWDEALGIGFQVGIYKRWEKCSVGAAYTSRQWVDDIPKYADLLRFNLDVPQNFVAGIAYRPNPKLELVLDYKFINWSSVALFGKTQTQGGLGWDDQHLVKFGASWKASDRWTLRGGLAYGKSPIDEDDVLANSFFPAIAEMHATLGASYAINDSTEVHAAYMHAFKEEMADNGQGDLFSFIGKGTRITLGQNSFTVGLTYKF